MMGAFLEKDGICAEDYAVPSRGRRTLILIRLDGETIRIETEEKWLHPKVIH